MLKPRIIPCLLIEDNGLVKTVQFKNPKYVGDPINAVRIFNEKEADELMVLDIEATRMGREPNFRLIAYLAQECRMPLCYGGGVRTVEQAKTIVNLGVEKVAISAAAIENPALIRAISQEIGRQSVVVVLDVKKRLLVDVYDVWTHSGTKNTKKEVTTTMVDMQHYGAGEIVINFIDRDGTMAGIPIEQSARFKSFATVPFTVLGGASGMDDLGRAVEACGLIGVAAGSLFVFKGRYRAVLINYPSAELKRSVLGVYDVQR